MQEFEREDQIRYIEGASIFLRVADVRRDLEVDFSRENASKIFLDEQRKKYFDLKTSESLSTLLPSKVTKSKFLIYVQNEMKTVFLEWNTFYDRILCN